MPRIGLYKGQIEFTDGYHRVAWLRDHGVKDLPVTASSDPGQSDEIEKLFGTEARVSILPPQERIRQ